MNKRMRRELLGILFFFLVLFTLVSLFSYHANDPMFRLARDGETVQNLFGVMGAHVAGLLIGLAGIGAFCAPPLLLLSSLQFFNNRPRREKVLTLIGGLILIVATGTFLALWREQYLLFGSRIPAGGIVGSTLGGYLIRYANPVGGAMILSLVWLVGFMLTTGLSLRKMSQGVWLMGLVSARGGKKAATALKERQVRRKATAKKKTPRLPVLARIKEKLPARKPPEEKTAVAVSKPARKGGGFLKKKKPKATKEQLALPLPGDTNFKLPPLSFLQNPGKRHASVDKSYLRQQSAILEQKLEDFGVKGEVTDVKPGPVITTFEYKPAAGVKINKIVNLTDDLALALRAISIRIVAPIPGRSVIGIEIPNTVRETVRFKEMINSDAFRSSPSSLTICLGKDIVGNPVAAQLERMPHLLIAGATGTGKSVFLNAMICSFLYKAGPGDIKLIMIDPKRIELSIYDGIPHLITPVVTDVKKATNALFWAVGEMERRYELLSQKQVRNIYQYNRKIVREKPSGNGEEPPERLPYIVVIIDELADLMMVASRDVEVSLMRLAQMARAAGIHLILATQRPSVDVLTGIIKANFPTRLTFQVSSKTDSRTIIDTNGAESLLGDGDMLFLPPGTARIQRIHGPYLSEEELSKIVEFLKKQQQPEYDETVVQAQETETESLDKEDYDERYDDAVALVTQNGQASISMVQRHLRIGYNRAARIIEVMEKEGIIGPADGAKPREVLARSYDDMSS